MSCHFLISDDALVSDINTVCSRANITVLDDDLIAIIIGQIRIHMDIATAALQVAHGQLLINRYSTQITL